MNNMYKANDYKSGIKPVWCPGCGHFGVLNALQRAFAEQQIAPENIALISGIGCSSRLPGYLKVYGFNAVHGRALPIATGVKLANPYLKVVAAGGDGDGLSIGMGHFPHTAKRNIDITYVMMDNNIYGMTKGQASPTTFYGDITKTTPYGSIDNELNPLALALSFNATFIARGFSGDIPQLAELIKKGMEHKGFSFIHVVSPCITYRGKDQFKTIREISKNISDEHDPSDKSAAYNITLDNEKMTLGIIYQKRKPTYDEKYKDLRIKARAKSEYMVRDIIDHFLPVGVVEEYL